MKKIMKLGLALAGVVVVLAIIVVFVRAFDIGISPEKEPEQIPKMPKELAFELLEKENIVDETDVYIGYGATDSILGPIDKEYIFEREDGSFYCFTIEKIKPDSKGEYFGYEHKKNETFYLIEMQDCVYNADVKVYDSIEERIGECARYIVYWQDEEFHVIEADEAQGKENDVSFSEQILFSINNGASGFGTIWECTDATIMVYTDKTVHVFMDAEDSPEVCTLTLSDEDYEELQKLAEPEKITKLEAKEDQEVLDGSSYYIKLYDENDEEVFAVGGYMPQDKKFWKTYDAMQEILDSYGIEEAVDEWREQMESEY